MPHGGIRVERIALEKPLRIKRGIKKDDAPAQRAATLEDLDGHLFAHKPDAGRNSRHNCPRHRNGQVLEQERHKTGYP